MKQSTVQIPGSETCAQASGEGIRMQGMRDALETAEAENAKKPKYVIPEYSRFERMHPREEELALSHVTAVCTLAPDKG